MSVQPLSLDERVDHAIRTGAYKDVITSNQRSKGARQTVKSGINGWMKRRIGVQTYRAEKSWSELADSVISKPKISHYIKNVIPRKHWQDFPVLRSCTSEFSTCPHLEILDCNGVTLGYRVRLPPKIATMLSENEYLLPSCTSTDGTRITTGINRHYACWKDSNKVPFYSKQYLRDNAQGTDKACVADHWLHSIQGVLDYLSKTLRYIDPKMYAKMIGVQEALADSEADLKHYSADGGLKPLRNLAGAWGGMAINQGQITAGLPHIDHQDFAFGMNCVVGWGDYTSSKLVLWPLNLCIEAAPGDAVFFLGRVLTHNAVDIQPKNAYTPISRCIIDVFTHQNMIKWANDRRDWINGRQVKGEVWEPLPGGLPCAPTRVKYLRHPKQRPSEIQIWGRIPDLESCDDDMNDPDWCKELEEKETIGQAEAVKLSDELYGGEVENEAGFTWS